MTLTDLASLGSFISGVAVLISLIYLSLQIRQNTLAHRATAHQNRSSFLKDHLHMIADPAITPIFVRGLAGDNQLTDVEVTQFLVVMRNWSIGMSDVVWAHDHGVLDDETYQASVNAIKGLFLRPGARAFWQTYKPTSTSSFARVVEAALAATSATAEVSSSQVYNVAQWRAAIAAGNEGTKVQASS